MDLGGNKRETPRPNRGPGVVAAGVDPCQAWVLWVGRPRAASNRWLVGLTCLRVMNFVLLTCEPAFTDLTADGHPLLLLLPPPPSASKRA